MNFLQTIRDGRSPSAQKSKWRDRVNWPVFWIGQCWWFIETNHYGWNLMAGSDAEMICDGIYMVILALSLRPAVNGDGNG